MSRPESCSPERFLTDVANHSLQVKVDNGLYKHLTFSNNGSAVGRFDLVTWPGYLTICGDYGTFIFSRIPDMFDFFRTDHRDEKDLRRSINPGYWAEKCQARDRCGIEEFNDDYFEAAVLKYLKEYLKEIRPETNQQERNELWAAVHREVLGEAGDSTGTSQTRAAYGFSHAVNKRVGKFDFQNFLERSFTTYTFHYLWCCYAIAWGIWQYDKMMESKNADSL